MSTFHSYKQLNILSKSIKLFSTFFLLSFLLILNVHAEETITIKDISIDSKTESLTINNPAINNNIIDTNIVLHNLNDFIYLNK